MTTPSDRDAATDRAVSTATPRPPLKLVVPPEPAAAPSPPSDATPLPSASRTTPAMKQYTQFKREHPGCILLFRIGDFYEMFDDDAVAVSKAIGLTLTQRSAGVPMAGLPYTQLDTYLRKLLRAGFRVAVADQVQDASAVKGNAVIERKVTQLVTPGTLVDEPLLADDEARTLAAVCFPGWGDDSPGAVAIADLSTGAFTVLACPAPAMGDELARRSVGEVLYPETSNRLPPPRVDAALRALGLPGTPQPQWHFRQRDAHEALLQQFGVASLEAFGLAADSPEVAAAGAIVRYLRGTQAPDGSSERSALRHLRPPRRETQAHTLQLDATTLRALEIERTIRAPHPGSAADASSSADGSLLGLFLGRAGSASGACRTAMGKRLLREWLCRPPAQAAVIRARQQAVATLVEDRKLAGEVGTALAPVQDVERIAARVALRRCSPRDLVALARSLAAVKQLAAAARGAPALLHQVAELAAAAPGIEPLAGKITFMCVDDPPGHLREGGLVRPGINADLDEARLLQTDAGAWLAQYQARLVAEHAIPSLKVGFNKVFGYFIELSKAQAQRAPASFSRRQTLTGAERFITPELKDFEDKVTHAQARALEREREIFETLCADASAALAPIARFAAAAAELDALLCMADKAAARGWCRPEILDEPVLEILQGRHPVLDERLSGSFVPNDAALRTADQPAGLAIITGPNMAGKSTFIRQVALIVLLAHAGSFVPAQSARIGVCDRIFTRVGADDALFAGQSTFMVEMTETAGILHHATERSLVILDEVGRGTSTLDGLALAWAIAETLASPGLPSATPKRSRTAKAASPAAGPRAFFATHYHELTKLQELLEGRVTNLHVAVREWEDQIVFLHRILPGRTDRSYGLHVAKLAGVPAGTIARAREVLDTLTVQQQTDPTINPAVGTSAPRASGSTADGQLSLFTQYLDHPAVAQLRSADLHTLTPLQAFDLLRQLQDQARQP